MEQQLLTPYQTGLYAKLESSDLPLQAKLNGDEFQALIESTVLGQRHTTGLVDILNNLD